MSELTNKPWSYTTRTIIAIIGAIGLIWLVVVARPLIASVTIAALLAYLLDPLVLWLTRRTRASRLLASRVVYLLFLIVLAGIPAVVSTVAFSRFDEWGADLLAAITELRAWLVQPISLLGFNVYPQAVWENLEQVAGNAIAILPNGALDLMAGLTTNLLWGLTILVSLYYFLVDGPRIKPWLVGLAPADYQAEARLLLEEIDQACRLFLRAQLLIFLILLVLVAASTFLIVSLYRAGLLPLSPFGLITLLVIVYILIQQVDNVWLRPWFFGEQLKLHPGVVFVGLIGALALSGILGAILVVPGLAIAKIIGRYIHLRLLGQPPWPHLAPAAGTTEGSSSPNPAAERDLAPAHPAQQAPTTGPSPQQTSD
jgi:predicted PurR-regulated permease PerM